MFARGDDDVDVAGRFFYVALLPCSASKLPLPPPPPRPNPPPRHPHSPRKSLPVFITAGNTEVYTVTVLFSAPTLLISLSSRGRGRGESPAQGPLSFLTACGCLFTAGRKTGGRNRWGRGSHAGEQDPYKSVRFLPGAARHAYIYYYLMQFHYLNNFDTNSLHPRFLSSPAAPAIKFPRFKVPRVADILAPSASIPSKGRHLAGSSSFIANGFD